MGGTALDIVSIFELYKCILHKYVKLDAFIIIVTMLTIVWYDLRQIIIVFIFILNYVKEARKSNKLQDITIRILK